MKSLYLSASALVIKTFSPFWCFLSAFLLDHMESAYSFNVFVISQIDNLRLGGPLDEILTVFYTNTTSQCTS